MAKCLIELNNVDKKVKISPVGLFSGYDGRVYIVDKNTIINTKQKGIDLPLNVEHCATKKGCEAVGWFKVDSLTLKQDGVYAKLELTKEGTELIQSKKYRYLSPEFSVDEKRNVLTIDGVALVNTPNLQLEINQKGDIKMDKEQLQKLQQEIENLKAENKALKEANSTMLNKIKDEMLNSAISKNLILPKEKEALKELNINTLKTYLDAKEPLGHTKELNIQNNNTNTDEAYKLAQNLGWE